MDRTVPFALLAVALMVGWAAAPAAAGSTDLSVSVTQNDDGSATVTVTESVTENNTTSTSSVENASVIVEVLDENATYEGAGNYTTDENGTVSLPAPGETVNVSVTAEADGLNATTTATLVASSNDTNESEGNETVANESFGDRVSNFVHSLQNDSNVSHIGPLVAEYVLENNPGNPPDHAGPPEWLTNESKNRTQGPPEHAGPPGEDDGNETDGDERGPPDHAGPPDDDETDDNESDDERGGPPDHAGPPNDDEDDDDDDEDSDSIGVRIDPLN
ncbi:MAG: hypothetical protein V5A23_00925 [Halobacteriales archaeon]